MLIQERLKMSMQIRLERYFYPVGQGLCCLETFKCDGEKTFTIVYDCGSGMQEKPNQDAVENIKKFINSQPTIDVLILSHFHNDHTNMVEELIKISANIKKIIIPYIDKKEYNMLRYIDANCNIRLLNSSVSEENYLNISTLFLRNELEGSDEIESLIPEFVKKIWNYRIFNYQFITRSEEFKKQITKEEIEYKDLDKAEYVLENKDKLKRIYKSIGDLNEQSIILFSYPKSSCKDIVDLRKTSCLKVLCLKHCIYSCCKDSCIYYYSKLNYIYSGCIYFGDYPIKTDRNYLKIDKMFKYICKYVGLIQFPHHGGSIGKKQRIIKRNTNYVFSFGIGNSYGHPKKESVSAVLQSNNCPIFVTEYCGYVQYYII